MTRENTENQRKTSLRRILKWAGVVFGGIALLVMVIVFLLLLPPVRTKILSSALPRLNAALPGDITVEEASWPSPGSLELSHIRWFDESDLLLSADRIAVSVNVFSLFKRDVELSAVTATRVSANIPAIVSRFPGDESDGSTSATQSGGGFPREGSLRDLPSIAIGQFFISARSVRVDDESELIDGVLSGGLDLLHGHSTVVRIDTLAVEESKGQWGVETLTLDIDIEAGSVSGYGRGKIQNVQPVYLSITPDGSDRFIMVFSGTETGSPPDETGIRLAGTLTRDGLSIESLTLDADIQTPGTTDLSRIPALSTRLEGLPPLEGIGLVITASLQLKPELAADVTCDISRNGWLDGGRVAVEYRNGVLDIKEVSLNLPGLVFGGSAKLDRGSVTAVTNVRVRGDRWLKTFRPGLGTPDTLSMDLVATVNKSNPPHLVSAEVDITGQVGGLTIDRVLVDGDVSLDDSHPSTVNIIARAMDINIGVASEIDRRSGVMVRLAPILVQTDPIPETDFPVVHSSSGYVSYNPAGQHLDAKNIRITGEGGDININAVLDSAGTGTIDVECLWPELPMLVVTTLGLSPESIDSLGERWQEHAPYRLSVSGELLAGDPKRTHIVTSFSLPGPGALSPLFSDSARVEDLGPVAGELELHAVSTGKDLNYEASLDLNETSWIDTSIVRLHGVDRHITVDTVGISVEGIHFGMEGSVIDTVFDLRSTVDILNSEFVRRFVSNVPDITLHGAVDLAGTPEAPRANAVIDASVDGPSYSAPQITSEITVNKNGLAAFVRMPEGVAASQVRLDHLYASYVSLDGVEGLFPARFSIAASGENIDITQSVLVDTTGGLGIDVDTLNLVVGGQDLHARRPFRIEMLPGEGGVVVGNVDLAGTMGRVQVTGFLRPDSSDLTGRVELTFPPEPPASLGYKHLWPERVDMDLQAKGKHDISINTRLWGFSLVTERRPVFDIEIKSDSTHVETRFSVADSIGTLIEGEGYLPASIIVYPPAASLYDGPVSLDVTLDRFPTVVRLTGMTSNIPEDEIVRVDGRIRVGGTTESVNGDVIASVDFDDWPKLSKYDLDLEATLGLPDSKADSTSESFVGEEFEQPPGNLSPRLKDGVAGTLRLDRDGIPMLTATVKSPLEIFLNPPSVSITESDNVYVQVDADSVPLGDFDPLISLDVGLGGALSITFTGSGPLANPDLDGRVEGKGFEISVADQARMIGEADIRIAGTRAKPEITGDIEIKQALIRVPDKGKNLHPVEGEAILLVRDSVEASTDTIRVSAVDTGGSGISPDEPSDIDLDVNIRIPSGFWIRGKGLDLELAGDLAVKQKGAMPTLTGELRVIRGTLAVLGRTLELERGVVTFYGGDEINPSLDVVLGVEIEGTKVQILFGGTAQKPELKFVSNPEMPEADIISVLLFGRPYGNLNDGQASLVKDRTADMLVSIGAARLQRELGGQLGIDVVKIKSTGADNAGTALSVGKYLKPQVLLSYAYALDKDSDSFVSLEYFLRGQFKLETIFGNQGQTSVGIGWSKDY